MSRGNVIVAGTRLHLDLSSIAYLTHNVPALCCSNKGHCFMQCSYGCWDHVLLDLLLGRHCSWLGMTWWYYHNCTPLIALTPVWFITYWNFSFTEQREMLNGYYGTGMVVWGSWILFTILAIGGVKVVSHRLHMISPRRQ